MAAITSENAAQAFLKLLAATMLSVLRNAFVMGALVNRNWENTFANQGDAINIPIPAARTARNLAEGGTLTMDAASLGNAQVVLNRHIYNAFTIPDVLKALAHPELLEANITPAAIAVAEDVEQTLLNKYTEATVNVAIGVAGPITEDQVDQAETNLFKQKVPATLPRYLVVHPDNYADIRKIPRFSDDSVATGLGLPAIVEAQVRQIKGFLLFRSQLVPVVSGVNKNLAFARDFLALVTRPLPPPATNLGVEAITMDEGGFGLRALHTFDHPTLSERWSVDLLYGATSLRPSFGQVING